MLSYITGELHYVDQPNRRRVIAIVYYGPDAVKKVREITGPTNPHVAHDGPRERSGPWGRLCPSKTPRGAIVGDRMDNLVHASASDAEAEREINFWFRPNDIMPYVRAYATETCGLTSTSIQGRRTVQGV